MNRAIISALYQSAKRDADSGECETCAVEDALVRWSNELKSETRDVEDALVSGQRKGRLLFATINVHGCLRCGNSDECGLCLVGSIGI